MTDLMERIRKDPYNFIMNYYESIYKYMGGEVFSTLSLVIPSLILPTIPHEHAREIKSSINMLLIAPPGTAKSSIAKTFEKLAYNAFPFESITDAKLYEVISQKDFVSLIIGDIFKVFSDKNLSKTMENLLGDEQKISRMTKRTDSHEKKINAVGFLAGTPNSLTSIISDGLIFRTSICLIFHNPDEHESIGEFVGNGAFKDHDGKEEEDAIYQFYQELLEIQLNKDNKIDPIVGYIVKDKFRSDLIKSWKPLVRSMNKRTKFSFFRELHSGFKYMVSHAFLNIYNRETIDGKIVIEEEDVRVAIKLMEKELKTKFQVLECSKVVSEERLKTTQDLAEYIQKVKKEKKMNISSSSKDIMSNLMTK